MKEDFFDQRNEKCRETVESILPELPPYAADFFIGIENTTAPLTRKNYAYDLRIFFYFLATRLFRNKSVQEITLEDLENLRADDIERFSSFLTSYEFKGRRIYCKEYAKARKIASVRSFYKYFFRRDRLNINVAAKVSMPKLHEKEIVRLEATELTGLLDVVETGEGLSVRQKRFHEINRVRDTAIVMLFLGTGIRISELVSLNVEDLDFSINAFRVTRKGGNRTVLYFPDEVAKSLKAWLSEREKKERLPNEERALFISSHDSRMSVKSVQNLVKKYSQINTPLKKITPHKLRSTFGTNLYRETGDIYVVANVLGHSDVNTTKRHYAALSDDMKRSAVNRIRLKREDENED